MSGAAGTNNTTSTNPSVSGQAPVDGQGQAPTPGQQVQAASTTTPSSSSNQSAQQQPAGSGLTPEALAAEVARLNKELGDTRKEAAQHRTELKKFQDAQLTDQQKLEQRAAEAEAARDAYKARIASYAVQLAAQKLGIIDPELATLAIAGRLQYGEDGQPTNAEELLTALAAQKPYLVGQSGAQGPAAGIQGIGSQAGQQRPAAQSRGAVNPGANAGPARGSFTREQLAEMARDPQVYAANRTIILRQLADEGKQRNR